MTDDIVKHLQDAAWCKHYNDGGNNPSGKLMEEAADEIERLRAENEKLLDELEMMRKACRKACKANYKLGIDKGKEKAIVKIREMGE